MSRHGGGTSRRLPILLALPAALIAGGLADRTAAPGRPVAAAGATVQVGPEVPPAGAYSSSWFCAGAADSLLASPADAPAGSVVIDNVTGRTEQGTIRVLSSTGEAVSEPLTVGPHSATSMAESIGGGAPWVGAVVSLDGAAAVEEVLDGPLGRVLGTCATSGSPNWFLPAGQTRVNASEVVLLLNPFPSDSIVDLSFTTDDGQEQPQDDQDITVPAGQLVAVDLGAHLRRRSAIATTVSARFGRVVAWSEEIVTPPQGGQPVVGTAAASAPLADPAAAVPGVALTLGAPDTATRWVWPDGLAGNGVDEQYLVFDPGSRPAEVRLSIGLAEGTAEPFQLSVGPGQVVPVVSEQQTRIPAGSAHTADLVSTNGVPVVAVRAVDAADPSAPGGGLQGISTMLGEQAPAATWVVPWSGTDGGHRGQLVIDDPGPRPASVTIRLGGGTVQTVSVPAGGRRAVAAQGPAGPLEVRADAPVYTEYDLYTDGASGYSLGPALPLVP